MVFENKESILWESLSGRYFGEKIACDISEVIPEEIVHKFPQKVSKAFLK